MFLQVPLGSVTPLAVVQPTASAVVLLLDHKLKGKDRILVHPLTNTSTVALSSEGLEAFLRYIYTALHQTYASLASLKFRYSFCAGMLFPAWLIKALCLSYTRILQVAAWLLLCTAMPCMHLCGLLARNACCIHLEACLTTGASCACSCLACICAGQ